MTLLRLMARSLAYYRGVNLGVALGAAVATAVLVGALLVGDSVRGTLLDIAMTRIGSVRSAVVTQDRFFRAALAEEDEAALLMLPASVSRPDETSRANRVQVIGVDERFWKLSPGGGTFTIAGDEAIINGALARQLRADVGDTIVARVPRPSALPRDMPLATDDNAVTAVRVTVKAIAGNDEFGRFSLQANQATPFNLFLAREMLAGKVGMSGRANVILSPSEGASVAGRWTLEDVQLEWREGEVRSSRVFIDQPLEKLGTPLLTYFVNRLHHGERVTPYSMVTAIDNDLTAGLDDNDTVITQWLADDLGAKVGDAIVLTYYVMDAGNRLLTRTTTFTVARIVPTDDPAIDPRMMPDFPGISQAEHCREWDAGFDIDYKQIREKDEAYWKQYRGTPKALVRFATGKRLGSNRFGHMTAVRNVADEDAVRKAIDIGATGLRYQDLRGPALAAATQSLDFGQLFLGMSFFLIVAAMVLTGLLFVFGVEQRSAQIGMLAAVGLPASRIRRLLLGEGLMLSIFGSLLGAAAGVGYTKAILLALATGWSDAVMGTPVRFHASVGSVAGGVLGGVTVAMIAIAWSLRRLLRRSPRDLLAGTCEASIGGRRGGLVVAMALVAAAIGVVVMGGETASVFFGAGSLLLLALIAACHGLLTRMMRRHAEALSIASLGARSMARRRGRSLAVIILLACGCFLVIAVGASRHEPEMRGIQSVVLYGESTLPIVNVDFGKDIAVAAMRVREGDDASCLNLNRAQQPTVIGMSSNGPWSERLKAPHDCIGDEATLTWGLHKAAGDVITVKDEAGREVELRVAAVVPNWVLQGAIVVSETDFIQLYPSQSGYRRFLIEAQPQEAPRLTSEFRDYGLEIMPAKDRLAMFSAVEHAYLSIFAALGALGLGLGTVGLGMVVLRNMLERRGELALLTAVGWSRPRIQFMVWSEHAVLLALGVGGGAAAALVAVHRVTDVPVGSILAIVLSGMLWIAGATWIAMRGNLIEDLRRE